MVVAVSIVRWDCLDVVEGGSGVWYGLMVEVVLPLMLARRDRCRLDEEWGSSDAVVGDTDSATTCLLCWNDEEREKGTGEALKDDGGGGAVRSL